VRDRPAPLRHSRGPARRGLCLAVLALLGPLALAACQAPAPAAPAGRSPASPVAGAPSPVASAPAAPPAAAPQRVTLVIPAKSLAFLPYYIGLEKGLYEAEGLQVEIQIVQSNLAIAAMTAGEIVYTASVGSSIQAAVAGQPFKAVLFIVKDLVFALVAAPEIATVADLRGKTIAITNITATDDYAWRAAVRAHGVSPDEVTAVTAQTTANSFAALTSGAVQAAMLSPPFDEQAERMGFRQIAWTADYLKRAQSGLVTTNRQLQEQPDEVRRMLRATLRSIHYTLEHEGEAVALITREFGIASDLAQGTYQKVARVLSRDGEVAPEVVREEIEDSKARLGINPDVPASQVIDFGPLREVQRELGLRP
jgi:NitT/TauT family transport system substrate-binding protein